MEEVIKEQNPWFSMWTEPRATMRKILDSKSENMVMILAMAGGVAEALDRAAMNGVGEQIPLLGIVLVALVGGAVGGVISLYISGALVGWTGQWIGGQASYSEVRTAIAWSKIPAIWALILWVPELALFGKELFTSNTPNIDASLTLTVIYFGFILIELVIGIWAFVVVLKCLGEAQGFSAWMALANLILSVLVIAVPIGLIALLISFVT